MDAIKVLLTQFTKNIESQPGWVPLVVVVYVLADFLPTGGATPFWVSLSAHREIFVVVVTFLAYQLGDAIDKAIFDRYVKTFWDRWFPDWVKKPRDEAQKALGVNGGVYKVAKALADAAGAYQGTLIQVCNELAKFARSVALPLLILPLVPLSVTFSYPWLFPVAGVLLFIVYLVLKPLHMGMLYTTVKGLTTPSPQSKYTYDDLPSHVRLFFWDSELVTSERLSGGEDTRRASTSTQEMKPRELALTRCDELIKRYLDQNQDGHLKSNLLLDRGSLSIRAARS